MKITIAKIISFFFNPVLLFAVLPFILIYRTTADLYTTIIWEGYSIVFLLTFGLFVIYAKENHIFTDLDVSKREQRPLLFVVSLVFVTAYFAGLLFFHGPKILYFMISGLVVGIVLASIINTKLKASIHVATVAGLIIVLAISRGGYYFFLLAIIPLVGWARLVTKRHTLSEAIVGGIMGTLLSLGMYLMTEYFFNF